MPMYFSTYLYARNSGTGPMTFCGAKAIADVAYQPFPTAAGLKLCMR